MAATYDQDNALLGKTLQIMVEGVPGRTATVNVRDVCSDSDCDGCCKTNTGNKAWKLIDIEKWPGENRKPTAGHLLLPCIQAYAYMSWMVRCHC
jgi:hypothetical protein